MLLHQKHSSFSCHLTSDLNCPSEQKMIQVRYDISKTLQSCSEMILISADGVVIFLKIHNLLFFTVNLLLVPVFVRLFCRETERAGKERLIEKQQRRRKSGQPAAQEKQRDGENAVRTQVWDGGCHTWRRWPRPSHTSSAKINPVRQTEMTVVCLRPVRVSEMRLLPLFNWQLWCCLQVWRFFLFLLLLLPCSCLSVHFPSPTPSSHVFFNSFFSSPLILSPCFFFTGWWCRIKVTLH